MNSNNCGLRIGSLLSSPAGGSPLTGTTTSTSPGRLGGLIRAAGFTLVELLVSTAIIALIMLMLVQVTNNISSAWRSTAEKVEKFQGARDGFEAMTRRISQATLNTYWDYYDVTGVTRNQSTAPGSFLPFSYGRQSDLRFISGPMSGCVWSLTNTSSATGSRMLPYWPTHGIFFQAPLGNIAYLDEPFYGAMDNMLNTWGYFVEVNCDQNPAISAVPPFLLNTATPPPLRWRARLMELQVPAEYMNVYDVPATAASAQRRDWYLNAMQLTGSVTTTGSSSALTNPLSSPMSIRPARVLAENVLALIFLPKLSTVDENYRKAQTPPWYLLSPDYTYDSTLLPTGGAPPSPAQAPVNYGAQVVSSTNAGDAGGIDPRNQLPPEIQVVMIAIDERSAQRLLDLTNSGASLPTGSTTNLNDPTFGGIYSQGSVPLFTQGVGGVPAYGAPPNYFNQLGDGETAGTDLYTFTQALVTMHLTYRIFTTSVSIRGAKWSRAQTN